MISKSQITNPGGASGYYTREQAAAEYYSGEAVPSAWRGEAAALLGLEGRVEAGDLTRVLEGKIVDATGARELGRMRIDAETGEKTVQHRAGWDLTISAPKSLSIQALAHGDKNALEAHRRAVDASLRYLERHGAQFRTKSGEYRRGTGLVAASFEHVGSRAKDPQLHTHVLIANVTTDRDGKAYSLSNERLFEHRRAADAVYSSALAVELRRAGYAVRWDREGRIEIDHYRPQDLKEFSARSREIEAALAARGLTRESASAQVRDMAALDTRTAKAKDLPETREAHAARWQAQAEALGVTRAAPTLVQKIDARLGDPAAARDAVDKAVAHLTEREAVFSRPDLHMQALRFSQGSSSIDQIEKEIERRERAGDLLRADGGMKSPRYTSREALEMERETDRRLAAGRGSHQSVMTTAEFDKALADFESRKGFALSAEQRAASRMILVGGDRFQGVQGLAGTGKTTMLSFVREAAESQGWRVVGHSNGAEQSAVMERESGIKSTTTASHLIDERARLAERGRTLDDARTPQVPLRELRIMDEASMSGQRGFRDVVRATDATGARTVFLGDSRQHQSVEAGRAFERAQAHMPTATLGEASIRRQTTDHMKSAVSDILARREAQALQRLQVVEVRDARAALRPGADAAEQRAARVADNKALVQRIAKDYASLPAAERAKTLVLTSTNDDRRALNHAIRDELRTRGELRGEQRDAVVLRAADMTRQEARQAAAYREGQLVEVTSGRGAARETGRYTVERVDTRANMLRLRDLDTGQSRALDPASRGQRVQAYETEARQICLGDRMRFTENHTLQTDKGEVRVRNGQTFTVERIDGDKITVLLGEGKSAQRVVADTKALKADHDYAVTSYSSQGRMVDRVMIHHNTESGAHNARETYVNVTRARVDVVLYTQDASRMERQVGMARSKTAAHDVAPAPAPQTQGVQRIRFNEDHDFVATGGEAVKVRAGEMVAIEKIDSATGFATLRVGNGESAQRVLLDTRDLQFTPTRDQPETPAPLTREQQPDHNPQPEPRDAGREREYGIER